MFNDFTNEHYNLFKKIASFKQHGLLEGVYSLLKKSYKNVIKTDRYLIAVGDNPIGLVAHLDTVFPYSPIHFYYDKEQSVIWSPEGLGADDRAGVFALLLLSQLEPKPTLIFLTDEECGGKGAAALVAAKKHRIKKLRFLIELDRQGHDDAVFYDCDNKAFTEYITSFGFHEEWGTFSDISIIAPAWHIAAVNLSIGYLNEHQKIETLNTAWLMETIEKVSYILQDDSKERFKYQKGDWSRFWESHTSLCEHCHSWVDDEDLFAVKGTNGHIKLFCTECLKDVHWCSICNRPFEVDNTNKDSYICNECMVKKGIKNGRFELPAPGAWTE